MTVVCCVQVAVFDTAFHQTMPERAYTYALPNSLVDEHGLRRYGAHGTSYQFLTKKAAQVLRKAQLCCPGNHHRVSSVAAVEALRPRTDVLYRLGIRRYYQNGSNGRRCWAGKRATQTL